LVLLLANPVTLINSPVDSMPIFDYSLIRPAGALIRTFGGISAGPDPLITLHNELKRKLVELGYQSVRAVEHMGEFSVRGGILDVFPMTDMSLERAML